ISNEFCCDFLHQCLSSNSDLSSNLIQSCNITLHRLYIRLNHARFLESLIEYIPNLEQISVEFDGSLQIDTLWKSNIEALKQSNENWFNKIPKLQCFSLKSFIDNDLEFIYLKWLLNNLNYVKKLQVHIKSFRPDYKRHYDDRLLLQWLKSLQTSESIAQHVIVFEQDLWQLTDKLKDFTFLDIYGEIHYTKVEPYRLMAQARFPHSRVDVDVSRFRLWL
ncbi:unnamed protein product, partial [Rotaria sp. Silwood2]